MKTSQSLAANSHRQGRAGATIKDCLIWIGNSYPTIDDYVAEAARRGCCRQVPNWPTWADSETRVFLAHRGDRRRPDQGVIFGYFELTGVDVVLTQDDCDAYKKITAKAVPLTNGNKHDDGSLEKFLNSTNGQKTLDQLDKFWRDKLPRNRLPFTRPSEAPKDSVRSEDDPFIKFLLDFIISCEDKPRGDGHFGYGISTHQTALEEARDCAPDGLRTGPDKYRFNARSRRSSKAGPSFYFVDSLTRWIDKEFCRWLKKAIQEAIQPKVKTRKTPRRKQDETLRADRIAELRELARIPRRRNRQQGVAEFTQTLATAAQSWHGRPRIPSENKKFTTTRGAIVLFAEPYPFFKRTSRAAFRGLLRVDGNELLTHVRNAYSRRRRSREIRLPTLN